MHCEYRKIKGDYSFRDFRMEGETGRQLKAWSREEGFFLSRGESSIFVEKGEEREK